MASDLWGFTYRGCSVVTKISLGGMHLQIQPTTKTNIRVFEKSYKVYIACEFAYLTFGELVLTYTSMKPVFQRIYLMPEHELSASSVDPLQLLFPLLQGELS